MRYYKVNLIFIIYIACNVIPFTACNNGDVLLYNGSHVSRNFTEGTVLVCYDNTYGTVCDDFWDELEASVICKQLGYGYGIVKSKPKDYVCYQ